MSTESDARDCLLWAINERLGGWLSPGDIPVKKPAGIGFLDHRSYLIALRMAAECLQQRGYDVGVPDEQSAEDLYAVVLTYSVMFLSSITG